MIYIDVSSSCKSPMHTGMQRMTRKIYAELERRAKVHPICWNEIGRHYHSLGRREMDLLERPFEISAQASAQPQRAGDNFFAELQRSVLRKKISLEAELKPGDALLIPDLYRGTRAAFLPRLIRKTGVKSAAIFHDAAGLRLGFLGRTGRERFRHYLGSLAGFDLVICISEEARSDLLRFWNELKAAPTRTVVERWPVEFDGIARARGAGSNRQMILSVGTLEARKNGLVLLEAAETLWKEGRAFELQVIGRSAREYGRQVVRQIRRLGESSRAVHWRRHVNDEELHRTYRDCAFTVYPSLMEGFGLPILESLWHGKPCVCGKNGALGEAGAGGGCLMVDQTNPASLAAAMRCLLTDPNEYNRLAEEARARRFRTWADYIESLEGHLIR